MVEVMLLWSLSLGSLLFSAWYVKEGYYYGFVKKKYKKSTFHLGNEDEDYLYGKDAQRMGTVQILAGIVGITLSLYLLYAYYILGIVKM
jgi:hypothetical protein